MQSVPSFVEHVRTAADAPMHYIEAGQGELLVLIHGSLCDYRYWRWQMNQLASTYRVVAPSLPGCWPDAVARPKPDDGGSFHEPALLAGTPYRMERHVRAILDLCDALSPQAPIRLLGHSRGAQVALEAALAMPDRVGAMILADPGFPFADEAPVMPVHARIAEKLGSAPLDDVMGEFVDAVNGAGTWRNTVSWFKDMVRANAWTLPPQLLDIDRSIDAARLSGKLTCPTLLIGGEFSPPRYGERISRLMRILPQARQVTIPRAAHGMNLANARRFNDAVLEFLETAA